MPTLSPNFLDELRARTPIAALIGRSVRLTRSGRDVKGCCPFHAEKTPSFYVYEDHFHCFGCGEHGDAITFVMKSTGASFVEAVEVLSAEAGLEVPKASPQAAEAELKRANLIEVLEAASSVYRDWLHEPAGAEPLKYLKKRGLTDETIEKFGLGWSGEGRGALAKSLSRRGITTEQLIQAGLMKSTDYGSVDMFFSRIMFPIRDRRGSLISFGGRVMGDGQPKYLNGPETVLFSKRRSLYGLNLAREAVRKGATLLVVEGYMDVIGLAQAGFGGAVAPLGTALTEDQLAELWRLSPVPVLGFDADNAGRKATFSSIQLAFPHLAPDRSLKSISLPESEDPDSFIQKRGARAFQQIIENASPLSKVLYGYLAEGADLRSAEGRAAFRTSLKATALRISNRDLASEIRKSLLDQFFGPKAASQKFTYRAPVRASEADEIRSRILTSIIVSFPNMLPLVQEILATFVRPNSYDHVLDIIEKNFTINPLSTEHDFRLAVRKENIERDFDEIKSYLPAILADAPPQSEVSAAWDELISLMPESLNALRLQKAELKAKCEANGSEDDWKKYISICQMAWRQEHLMDADDL